MGDEAALKTALARDENGRAVDVKAFRSAILNNRKRRSLAEAEPEMIKAHMSVDQDNGAMLQEYLMKEHKYKSENRRDGSSLLPEAMRAKTRVPRDVTYIYKEMNSVGLNYGP